ncbi:MAG TPA: phage integrase SAM-like domain-containing protein [Hanamia sp.]|nr:phage integrase SAM-like domain-containing protein [Hanamia sp.]
MRHPIKLIVRKGKVRNDGTALISLQYCYSAEQRVILSTGVGIPLQFWNRKTGRISKDLPSTYGDVQQLETVITEKLRKAEDMVTYALKQRDTCPMKFLKENFHLQENWKFEQMSDTEKNLDIYFNIDDYVKSKQSTVKHCTINVINAMKAHLKSFESFRKEPITFDSFDMNFYEAFVKFLTYDFVQLRRKEVIKGLRINTVGKTIKHLKSFLKDRMRKKIIPYMELGDYKVMEEIVDTVYLNWKELSLIYHLDLTANSQLEKYRDLFVLGCLTGFRFSDYSDIKPEEVRDGMLYVNQTKTLSTVVVPLRNDAKKILIEKYNMQMPQVSNPNFNHYIKEVVRLAGIDEIIKITHKQGNKIIEETRPKYNWIMSHTCRRSFCTNEFLDGTPTNLIMAISGHKTEKAFRRYIKADQVQKAHMIKKLWDDRPGL